MRGICHQQQAINIVVLDSRRVMLAFRSHPYLFRHCQSLPNENRGALPCHSRNSPRCTDTKGTEALCPREKSMTTKTTSKYQNTHSNNRVTSNEISDHGACFRRRDSKLPIDFLDKHTQESSKT